MLELKFEGPNWIFHALNEKKLFFILILAILLSIFSNNNQKLYFIKSIFNLTLEQIKKDHSI